MNPDLYVGMKRLETSLAEDPSLNESLDLYFSVDITSSVDIDNPCIEEVDLCKGGRNRRVSSENIGEYNDLMLKHILFDNYKNEFYFLLKGIFEVIPQIYFSIFTESELATIIEGEKGIVFLNESCVVIDVDDWRRNTVYTNEFYNNHPVVNNFWEILRGWKNEQRSLLLAFATGYSYPPV